jgi:hypothetical protein
LLPLRSPRRTGISLAADGADEFDEVSILRRLREDRAGANDLDVGSGGDEMGAADCDVDSVEATDTSIIFSAVSKLGAADTGGVSLCMLRCELVLS